MSDWNDNVIAEFRANGGKVGGNFAGAPLLILHSTGAKSGQERVSPLVYQQVGGDVAIFASKGGAPTNPDWLHNVKAHPEVTVEIGTDTVAMRARVASDVERDPIWARQKEVMPNFADYEASTDRTIPVVILELCRPPAGDGTPTDAVI